MVLAALAYAQLSTVMVVGDSMTPTLQSGDRAVILHGFRWLRPLRPGDIVAARVRVRGVGETIVVKRIAWIHPKAGPAIWPKTLTVLGESMDRELLFPEGYPSCPTNVRGGIYVLGDNLEGSEDSRDYGPLTDDAIMGRLLNW
jgi:signal peptidase I